MYIVVILLIIGVIGFGYLASSNSNKEVVKDEVVEENIALSNKKDEVEVANTAEEIVPVANGTNTDPVTDKKEAPTKSVATKPVSNTSAPKPVDIPVPAPTPVSVTKSYTAEEVYFVSNNKYTIDVTLEVKDGVVTNADVMYGNKETGYEHPLQEKFDGAYSTLVIGKKIDDISLSRVGGASLTSKAFNEAVDKIQTQVNS